MRGHALLPPVVRSTVRVNGRHRMTAWGATTGATSPGAGRRGERWRVRRPPSGVWAGSGSDLVADPEDGVVGSDRLDVLLGRLGLEAEIAACLLGSSLGAAAFASQAG